MKNEPISREQQLENALRELLDYTVDVLTGHIMTQFGITWPKGGPRNTSPILIKAQKALDRKD